MKSIDSNHMLEAGLEGFYGDSRPDRKQFNPGFEVGSDFFTNNQIPQMDFTTIHIYPDQWQVVLVPTPSSAYRSVRKIQYILKVWSGRSSCRILPFRFLLIFFYVASKNMYLGNIRHLQSRTTVKFWYVTNNSHTIHAGLMAQMIMPRPLSSGAGSHHTLKMQVPSESHSSSLSLEDHQSNSALPKGTHTTGQPSILSMHRPELAARAPVGSSGSTWNKEWTTSGMAMRSFSMNVRLLHA